MASLCSVGCEEGGGCWFSGRRKGQESRRRGGCRTEGAAVEGRCANREFAGERRYRVWCPPGRASTIDCRFGRGGGSGWRAESLRGDNTEACCEVAGEQSERTGQRRATGWDGFWAAVVVSGRLKSRTPRRAGLGVGRAVGGSISVRAAAGG